MRWRRRGREAAERPLEGTVAKHGEVETHARTRLVLHWAEIAIEQERLAQQGRAELERAHQVGEQPYKLKAELQPALVAVAACAHSLDALYAELAELVGPETLAEWTERTRGGRWAQVAGILELAVERDVEPWRPRLQTLYQELRNPAVHPKAKAKALKEHPALRAMGTPEYAIYTVEAVRESVDLLLEVLSACVEVPKPPIETWANDTRTLVEGVTQSREPSED
jgi:hypothetical protein